MPLDTIKKVCVIRYGGFGDIMAFTNCLRDAHQRFPGAMIDYVVASEFVQLFDGCDLVDRIIGHDRSGGIRGLIPFITLSMRLRREKYDLIIDWHDNTRSRAMVAIAHPRRVVKTLPPLPQTPAMSDPPAPLPGDEYLKDRTPLWLSKGDREFITSLAPRLGKPVIGLCLVGSWETKRWPATHFAALANMLVEKRDATIVLIGGPSDTEYAATVAALLPPGRVMDFAGKTTLSRSVAITLLCDVIVSGDSGMLHATFVSGVPQIGLFGCTDHTRFGHTGDRSVAVSAQLGCSPCHERTCRLGTTECMTSLTPERVFAIVEDMLDRPSG